MNKQEGFTGQHTFVIPDYILQNIPDDPLNAPLYFTDIGYYPEAREHYRIRPEGCKQFILIYCINGEGWISVNGIKNTVKANQYFVIPAKTPHAYASNKNNPWTIYWVHYSGTSAPGMFGDFKTAQSINPSPVDRIEERLLLFKEILQNLEMGYSYDNFSYANICLMHFLASFRFLSQFRQIRKIKTHDKIEDSILFMKKHIGQKPGLDELAKQAGFSISHYSALFKKKTNISPLEYLIQLKIQHACRLLDHSDQHIKRISQLVGYEDSFYFSRIFKKIMKVSPREYRNKPKG